MTTKLADSTPEGIRPNTGTKPGVASAHGGLRDEVADNLKARARQNVIFELGHFIGRLSRARVCALFAASVEIPSDYSGVLFVQPDESGIWKMLLAKELKAAGFSIYMNCAL